jgi:hypothetical protein
MMYTYSMRAAFDRCVSLLISFQGRQPIDFDTCIMEQSTEIMNGTLETSVNNTNQSLHSSRLSTCAGNSNVSFLKRRLFEEEDDDEDDVNLLPEDDEQCTSPLNTVTRNQKVNSPPRCDSETEVSGMKATYTCV